MSYQSDQLRRMGFYIGIVALLLTLLGFSLFFSFEKALKLFLQLSPDHSFVPQTVLILKSSFLSLGWGGIFLLLFIFWGREALKKVLDKLITMKESNFLLLFLGLSFLFRVFWIIFIPTQLYADWKWYDDAAYHLSQVWRYEENGLPTAYWPIGYPLFLAMIYKLFGHSYKAVEIINVILSLGICTITYLIAKRLLKLVFSRLTLIILGLFPSQIFFTNVLASEIVFTVLLLLVVYFCFKLKSQTSIYFPMIIGILLGLLTLVRASALLLPIVIVIFYFKSRDRIGLGLRNAVLTIAFAFLSLLPWMLRNKQVLGSFTVATSGGINLYIGNSTISSGSWIWQKENPFKDLSAPNEVENDRLGYKIATSFILHDPWGFILRGIKKEIFLFATDFSALAKELDLAAQSKRIDKFVIFNILGQVYYYLVLILSAGGVLLLWKDGGKRISEFFLWGGILIYWMGIHFIFFGIDRFHFPLIPIFSVLASSFLETYLQ